MRVKTMSHRQIRQLLFFVGGMLCFSLPTMAIAHVGGHETAGFWYGFQHPLGGLDHLIAMLAVGIWAVQLEDKQARIFLPLSFLGLMLLGGLLGMVGMALPGIEVGIIFSDLLLGCLIFFGARLPVAWSSLIIGALAVFHGYAHGAEMPANAQSVQYALGFLSGTASLHLIGMGAAFLAQRRQQVQFFRIAGAMMVLAGFTVFAQSL
ncbi:HupE/UreJ family protein [Synechococcus moorigangaii CMS01]|nr:HupE/UreJ family protein [Synechococcus moorigangaii CMS01]